MKKQQTVDEYFKTLPKETESQLRKIRETIKGVVPMGQEVISYGIPTFKVDGKPVIYFAGWKEHVSIYPIPKGNAELNKKIAPYIKGKGTLQFQLDKPIPLSLVKEVTKTSLNNYLERAKAKLK